MGATKSLELLVLPACSLSIEDFKEMQQVSCQVQKYLVHQVTSVPGDRLIEKGVPRRQSFILNTKKPL